MPVLVLGTVLAVVVGLAAPATAITRDAAGASSCVHAGTTSCPTTSATGYVYVYDARTKSFVSVPATAAGNDNPAASYTYALSPACPQSDPASNASCAGAQQFCASTGRSGLHENVWRRQVEPSPTNWVIVGDVCLGGLPDPVDAHQVLADVAEYERLNVPAPQAQVQPAGGALVNLPVIVSVAAVGPQEMAVRAPVPGLLVATPGYSWTFDDGTVLNGAGRPYDGADPRRSPAHYLSHTYRAPEANAAVTLTVTWRASFTAGGRTFAIPPLTIPPSVSRFSVYAAHSVLVNGFSP